MKLGASNVIDKPMTIEDLRQAVLSGLADSPYPPVVNSSSSSGGAHSARVPPRSAAERWAALVLKACEADRDFKTLSAFGAGAGVSVTSLCEICWLLAIKPKDARDLARVLRPLLRSTDHRCTLEALFDVSDRRTLKTLLERGGLHMGAEAGHFSIEHFLTTQRFVGVDNEGMKALRAALASSDGR